MSVPEQEHEVVVYQVEYLCDDCGEPMKVRGLIGTKPLTYEHVCVNKHEVTLDERYPQIRYRRYEDG